MQKYILIFLILLITAVSAYFVYNHNHKSMESLNICQNEEIVAKMIVNNVNPFSKFKFIKKRNEDCKILLFDNKDEAVKYKKQDFCPFLDASTHSVTVLINTYVHEMYDRENASKALRTMTPLMTPYDYCPQYMDDMITLIKIKKRLGL